MMRVASGRRPRVGGAGATLLSVERHDEPPSAPTHPRRPARPPQKGRDRAGGVGGGRGADPEAAPGPGRGGPASRPRQLGVAAGGARARDGVGGRLRALLARGDRPRRPARAGRRQQPHGDAGGVGPARGRDLGPGGLVRDARGRGVAAEPARHAEVADRRAGAEPQPAQHGRGRARAAADRSCPGDRDPERLAGARTHPRAGGAGGRRAGGSPAARPPAAGPRRPRPRRPQSSEARPSERSRKPSRTWTASCSTACA